MPTITIKIHAKHHTLEDPQEPVYHTLTRDVKWPPAYVKDIAARREITLPPLEETVLDVWPSPERWSGDFPAMTDEAAFHFEEGLLQYGEGAWGGAIHVCARMRSKNIFRQVGDTFETRVLCKGPEDFENVRLPGVHGGSYLKNITDSLLSSLGISYILNAGKEEEDDE